MESDAPLKVPAHVHKDRHPAQKALGKNPQPGLCSQLGKGSKKGWL